MSMANNRLHHQNRKSFFCFPRLLLVAVCVFASTPGASAQQQQPVTSAAAATVQTPPANVVVGAKAERDDRYRIGPGDVLDIRVFNKPILSRESVRVNGNGMIRMPLIEDDILAACRTEGELAKEIASRYLKYQRNPVVDVFVKEYQSQPVAVNGAVNNPTQFKLQRRVKLLELIAFANGPAERAGRSINVVHSAPTGLVCQTASNDADDLAQTGLSSYKLRDTLDGVEQANPYIQPGDIVFVPDADQAYIVGNIVRPMAIPLREPVTISQAVAMAGGTQPDTKKEKIRIVRQEPGSSNKKEIYVDLRAVEKRQAEDIALQANDIVDVPTNSGKRLLKSFIGAVVPAFGNLPTRVVP